MAEEKKAVAQQEKKNAPAAKPSFAERFSAWCKKFAAWCKKLPPRIAKPFKSMWYELKKVTWPSKRKLIVCSVTVLVFMLFMGVIIGLLDMGASALVKLLVL